VFADATSNKNKKYTTTIYVKMQNIQAFLARYEQFFILSPLIIMLESPQKEGI